MFFVASKIGGILLFHPLNFLLSVAALGLLLGLAGLRRTGRVLVGVALFALLVVAFSPVSALLLRPLEERFPRLPDDAPVPAGIVVLGGAMDEDLSEARGEPTLTEAAARLTAGAALARRYPAARLVFTGGSADLRGRGADEARGVRRLWLALGVPEGRMVLEDRSRNTEENALFTRQMVAPRPGERWLLVTSAAHMPRSMGIFRHAGWAVTAAPVDYRTFGDGRDFHPTTLALDALRRLDVACHEWAGLAAYRLTGKTNALFPAP